MYDLCVVGLGKLGLPLAVYYASANANVIGLDLDEDVVKTINQGSSPIPLEANLESSLATVVKSGRFLATTDYEISIRNSKTIIVVVPLFIDKKGKPDFSAIDSAARKIGQNLSSDSLVIFETTLPVKTTRERIVPIIEQEARMRAEQDFFVAFSPERVLTGRVFKDLERYPKIVGGVGEKSALRALDFYEKYIQFSERSDLIKPNGVWVMESAEAAELVKLAETTYRDVNIALANTFDIYAERLGLDIRKIIEACNSQIYSHIHQPGISVGGHCIPVYPRLYLDGHGDAAIVSVARELNERMPEEYINRLARELDLRNKKILIYGLSYRPNVKETHNSGAFALKHLLTNFQCEIYLTDPLYSNKEISNFGFKALELMDTKDIEAILLHTEHLEFIEFVKVNNWEKLEIILLGRKISVEELANVFDDRVLVL